MTTAISSAAPQRPPVITPRETGGGDFAALIKQPLAQTAQARPPAKQIYYVGDFKTQMAPEIGDMTQGGFGATYLRSRTGLPVTEIQMGSTGSSATFGADLKRLNGTLDEIMAKGGRLDGSYIMLSLAIPPGYAADNSETFLALGKRIEEFTKRGGTVVTAAGDNRPNFFGVLPGVATIGASTRNPDPAAVYRDNPEIDSYSPGDKTMRVVDNGRGLDVTGDDKPEFKAAPGLNPNEELSVSGTAIAAGEALIDMVTKGRRVTDLDLIDRKLQIKPRQPGQPAPEIVILDTFVTSSVDQRVPGISHGDVVEGLIRSEIGDKVKMSRIEAAEKPGENLDDAFSRVIGELDKILARPGRLDHVFINKSLEYTSPPQAVAKLRDRLEKLIERGAKIYMAAGNKDAAAATDLRGMRVVGAKEAPSLPRVPSSDFYANNPFINTRRSGIVDIQLRPDGSAAILGRSEVLLPNAGVDSLVPPATAAGNREKPETVMISITGTSYAAPRELAADVLRFDPKVRDDGGNSRVGN